MATVLRIKRKRQKIPPKVLLVVSKVKGPPGDFRKSHHRPVGDRRFFYFALTITTNSPINDDLKERIRGIIAHQYRKKSSSLTERFTKSQMQRKSRIATLKNKLKSISLTRSHTTEKTHCTKQHPPKSRKPSSPIKIPRSLKKSSPTDDDRRGGATSSLKKTIHKQKLGGQQRRHNSEVSSLSSQFAKLPAHSNNNKRHSSFHDHVYDLYYSQCADKWNAKDVLYVKPCSYEELNSMNNPSTSKKKSSGKVVNRKEKLSKLSKTRMKLDGDDDSVDEDERRFILDEEDDFYDSDDYDATGRDDDDAFSSFFDHGGDDYHGGDNYVDYDDNLADDMGFDDGLDYANDINADDFTGNDCGDL